MVNKTSVRQVLLDHGQLTSRNLDIEHCQEPWIAPHDQLRFQLVLVPFVLESSEFTAVISMRSFGGPL